MNEEINTEEVAPWVLVALTVFSGVLRVLLLDQKGMWLDETVSVWLANHSVAEMLQLITRIDQHPPLYYLLLHYWIELFGNTAYNVRLLSGLFGAATVPIIYLIGKRISGAGVGLAAALFMAVSPFNIYYGQETRMYTLLAFLAAVAIYVLVVLITDPRSARSIGGGFLEYLRAWGKSAPVEPDTKRDFSYQEEIRNQPGWRGWLLRHRLPSLRIIETDLAWVAFILFSVAILYTHNTAVLYILAVNIFVLGLMLYQRLNKSVSLSGFQAPSFWNWVIAQIAILVLWSPWLSVFITQASAVYQEFWIPKPTWDAVIQTLLTFLNADGPALAIRLAWLWIVYALVLCLALVHYRQDLARFSFLAALFAVPFLGELIVSLYRPIFWDRTLIWTTIPLFVLLGAGIVQLRVRVLIVAVIGILAAMNLFAASDYLRFYQKEDWYTPAGYVANFAEKDDLVLFNSAMVQIPFDYYFKPFEIKYGIEVEKKGVPDMFERAIPEPRMTTNDIAQLNSLLSGRKRVWLVYSHDSYTDPNGLIPQALASRMTCSKTREFNGGKVQLYETP